MADEVEKRVGLPREPRDGRFDGVGEAPDLRRKLRALPGQQALETFDRYRRAGINIALGTDSFPPDMIRNMDYGTNVAKLVDRRLDAGRPADLFRAATLGGAAALGRDDLGRLAAGALADMVVIDLDDPRIGVVDDPIRTLLMNCGGANVRSVVVNGRFVMRDGTLPNVDERAMRARAQAYFDRMKEAYSQRDYLRRKTGDMFPASFADYQDCEKP